MLDTQFTRFFLDSEDLDIINSTQNSLTVQNVFRRQSLPKYQRMTSLLKNFIISQFVQMKSASPIARDTNVSPLPNDFLIMFPIQKCVYDTVFLSPFKVSCRNRIPTIKTLLVEQYTNQSSA